MGISSKFFVISILFVLFTSAVGVEAGRQLFLNRRSHRCPNGVIYREGCKLCYCIDILRGRTKVRCESRYPSPEQCAALSRTAHCDPRQLLYDYRWQCEGPCWCDPDLNLTVCRYLPCNNALLTLLGYYRAGEDEPDSYNHDNLFGTDGTFGGGSADMFGGQEYTPNSDLDQGYPSGSRWQEHKPDMAHAHGQDEEFELNDNGDQNYLARLLGQGLALHSGHDNGRADGKHDLEVSIDAEQVKKETSKSDKQPEGNDQEGKLEKGVEKESKEVNNGGKTHKEDEKDKKSKADDKNAKPQEKSGSEERKDVGKVDKKSRFEEDKNSKNKNREKVSKSEEDDTKAIEKKRQAEEKCEETSKEDDKKSKKVGEKTKEDDKKIKEDDKKSKEDDEKSKENDQLSEGNGVNPNKADVKDNKKSKTKNNQKSKAAKDTKKPKSKDGNSNTKDQGEQNSNAQENDDKKSEYIKKVDENILLRNLNNVEELGKNGRRVKREQHDKHCKTRTTTTTTTHAPRRATRKRKKKCTSAQKGDEDEDNADYNGKTPGDKVSNHKTTPATENHTARTTRSRRRTTTKPFGDEDEDNADYNGKTPGDKDSDIKTTSTTENHTTRTTRARRRTTTTPFDIGALESTFKTFCNNDRDCMRSMAWEKVRSAMRTGTAYIKRPITPSNKRTAKCPNGVFYRTGCEVCYCFEYPHVQGRRRPQVECDSLFTTVEQCQYWKPQMHCSEANLHYGYNPICEGSCTCDPDKLITVCPYLPCNNQVLATLGYYPTKGPGKRPIGPTRITGEDGMGGGRWGTDHDGGDIGGGIEGPIGPPGGYSPGGYNPGGYGPGGYNPGGYGPGGYNPGGYSPGGYNPGGYGPGGYNPGGYGPGGYSPGGSELGKYIPGTNGPRGYIPGGFGVSDYNQGTHPPFELGK